MHQVDHVLWLVRKQLGLKRTDEDSVVGTTLLQRADPARLANDEAQFGFTLPPLLKQLYREIGNGGFGPGYGLIGMTSGAPDDTGNTAPEIYAQFRSAHEDDPDFSWPHGLLPICHWGCGILSCVSCDEPGYAMYIFDPNLHSDARSWDDSFVREAPTFESWITQWAQGIDLWDKSRGENGPIANALAERAQRV